MTAKPKHRLRALIDTDVFVIDLRYPHDDRYEINDLQPARGVRDSLIQPK